MKKNNEPRAVRETKTGQRNRAETTNLLGLKRIEADGDTTLKLCKEKQRSIKQ